MVESALYIVTTYTEMKWLTYDLESTVWVGNEIACLQVLGVDPVRSNAVVVQTSLDVILVALDCKHGMFFGDGQGFDRVHGVYDTHGCFFDRVFHTLYIHSSVIKNI